MKYAEIYQEYRHLLNQQIDLQRQLDQLPAGYLSAKRISGKQYHYLQRTVHGKKESKYVKAEHISAVRDGIQMRTEVQAQMEVNLREQLRLEQAAKILDQNLARSLRYIKQCAAMDALPVARRTKALSFAKAMTALEGLEAQPETEVNLRRWARGEMKFTDFYLSSLQRYRVISEVPH